MPRTSKTLHMDQRRHAEWNAINTLSNVPRGVPPQLGDFMTPLPDVVRKTALELRKRVLAVMSEAHETVWDAVNASMAYSKQ